MSRTCLFEAIFLHWSYSSMALLFLLSLYFLMWICRHYRTYKSWNEGPKAWGGKARRGWFFHCWRKCAKKEAWCWISRDWRKYKKAGGMVSDASIYLIVAFPVLDALRLMLDIVNLHYSIRQHTVIYACLFWWEWYIIRKHQLSRVLRISCTFYYLVASSACFVPMMTIQVVAEREQKIESEVKEIKKVFYCNLCNKQYKLAIEFESHLSSYDHNHRKVTCVIQYQFFPL